MNNFNFEVSIWGVIASVGIRLIAAYFYGVVFYRAYKEVGVRNGLITLRKQLLVTAAILFFINTAGMTLLVVRPFATPEMFRVYTDILALVNSGGFFLVAYLLYKIYTQSYTIEQKKLHGQIESMENLANGGNKVEVETSVETKVITTKANNRIKTNKVAK